MSGVFAGVLWSCWLWYDQLGRVRWGWICRVGDTVRDTLSRGASDGPRGTIEAMTSREKLRRLADESSDDPMLQALAHAPEDDEPWTDDDEAAVAETRAAVAAGRTVSHEEMLRKHG